MEKTIGLSNWYLVSGVISILFVAYFLGGCASPNTQWYKGPEIPDSQLAVVFAIDHPKKYFVERGVLHTTSTSDIITAQNMDIGNLLKNNESTKIAKLKPGKYKLFVVTRVTQNYASQRHVIRHEKFIEVDLKIDQVYSVYPNVLACERQTRKGRKTGFLQSCKMTLKSDMLGPTSELEKYLKHYKVEN